MAQHSVLIIGCGSIGERHLRCFQQTRRAFVTGCDTDPEIRRRIESTYGVRTTADSSAALQQDFECVVICTPAPLHVPMAIAALNSGKHVLIEKPLSHSMSGVRELIQVARNVGRVAVVAYVLHVYPCLAQASAFLLGGSIGPVRHATVQSGQALDIQRPAYATTYYRDRRSGGGAIQDALTHPVNWVESVLGPTDLVYCDCDHLVLPSVSVEDTVHVIARNGPAMVNYSLNQFQAPNEVTFQLNSAAASVRIELHTQRWGIFRRHAADWNWQYVAVPGRDSHFVAQANAFMDEIENGSATLCSLELAEQSLRFNLAALASAERKVPVNPAIFGS